MKDLNWLGVIASTVVVTIGGYLWFNVAFASFWHSLDPFAPTAQPPGMLLGGILVIAVIGIGMSWFFNRLGVSTLKDAVLTALGLCIAFDSTVYVGSYFFYGEPLALSLFLAAFDLIALPVMGAILVSVGRKPAA